MTTVGEVILNYKVAGCPDRFRDERPADTKDAEETNCDNLLDFWEDIPVAIVSVAVFDRYCDVRKKKIKKKGCSGTGPLIWSRTPFGTHFCGRAAANSSRKFLYPGDGHDITRAKSEALP